MTGVQTCALPIFIDIYGKPIPGLFAGGEASGGGRQHGIGRACVHGYMTGTYAAAEPAG